MRKYLRTDRVEELRLSLREEAPIKLASFVAWIKPALLVDSRRPKKERRTAHQGVNRLRAHCRGDTLKSRSLP